MLVGGAEYWVARFGQGNILRRTTWSGWRLRLLLKFRDVALRFEPLLTNRRNLFCQTICIGACRLVLVEVFGQPLQKIAFQATVGFKAVVGRLRAFRIRIP